MFADRLDDLIRFYSILDRLEIHLGCARRLADCSGRMVWPKRGVYFFREHGESRTHTGTGPRVVRVGTHALKVGSNTKLWTRLSQHKGQPSTGGGNNRGSIFRLIVGAALVNRDGVTCASWGNGQTAKREVRNGELTLECAVSQLIANMPFLWLAVDDEAGPESSRGYIERNSIALLSNFNRTALDPPSSTWLGRRSNRERVRNSGLWNSNHVDEAYEPSFLDNLDDLVRAMGKSS